MVSNMQLARFLSRQCMLRAEHLLSPLRAEKHCGIQWALAGPWEMGAVGKGAPISVTGLKGKAKRASWNVWKKIIKIQQTSKRKVLRFRRSASLLHPEKHMFENPQKGACISGTHFLHIHGMVGTRGKKDFWTKKKNDLKLYRVIIILTYVEFVTDLLCIIQKRAKWV